MNESNVCLLALMRLSRNKLLHWIAVCYIEFIRGTPQMVQILFVYFGVGALISNLSAVVAGLWHHSHHSDAYPQRVSRVDVALG